MSREVCSCRSPIIVIDSYTEIDDDKTVYQVQELGCRNKDCPKYDVSIRTRKDKI